ncbi:hypothetical protein HYH03_013422 [Edaphochlamys debaryana]|uniref:Right handed beta helix domain-containing protein n=1 Tax=Edaphochlamys debaryana TaxID=47281 RepID=A0A835XPS0_9CHLO|nr:hypothetical protein HYH03_013422 [Edaphochlamys debaryana]|eukprot:KAG2487983.1 hypothetical protein HYH03_013422 [Edaphochlamys debaryana]
MDPDPDPTAAELRLAEVDLARLGQLAASRDLEAGRKDLEAGRRDLEVHLAERRAADARAEAQRRQQLQYEPTAAAAAEPGSTGQAPPAADSAAQDAATGAGPVQPQGPAGSTAADVLRPSSAPPAGATAVTGLAALPSQPQGPGDGAPGSAVLASSTLQVAGEQAGAGAPTARRLSVRCEPGSQERLAADMDAGGACVLGVGIAPGVSGVGGGSGGGGDAGRSGSGGGGGQGNSGSCPGVGPATTGAVTGGPAPIKAEQGPTTAGAAGAALDAGPAPASRPRPKAHPKRLLPSADSTADGTVHAAGAAAGQQARRGAAGVQAAEAGQGEPKRPRRGAAAAGTSVATEGGSAPGPGGAAPLPKQEPAGAPPGPLPGAAPASPQRQQQPGYGDGSGGAGAGGEEEGGEVQLAQGATGAGAAAPQLSGRKRGRQSAPTTPQPAPQPQVQIGPTTQGPVRRLAQLQGRLDALAGVRLSAALVASASAAQPADEVIDLGGLTFRGSVLRIPSGLTRVTISNCTIEAWVLVLAPSAAVPTAVTFRHVAFLGGEGRVKVQLPDCEKDDVLDAVTVAAAGAKVKLENCSISVSDMEGEPVSCISGCLGARLQLHGCKLGPGPRHGLVVYSGATAAAVRCTAERLDEHRGPAGQLDEQLKARGSGFQANGDGSRLKAEACTAERCGDSGFASTWGGVLHAGEGCAASHCQFGFGTDRTGSSLTVEWGCTVLSARETGFLAQDDAMFTTGPDCKAVNCEEGFASAGEGTLLTLGRGCIAERCGDGFSVGEGAVLDASAGGCVARGNRRHGFFAEVKGYLWVGPGAVSTGNGGDCFRASERGELTILEQATSALGGQAGPPRQPQPGAPAVVSAEARGNGGAGFRARGRGSCLKLPGEGWRASGNSEGDEPLEEAGGRVDR